MRTCTALVIALAILAGPAWADPPPAPAASEQAAHDSSKEVSVWITRTAPGWAKVIRREAGRIPGVQGVEVDTDHQVATIHYSGASTPEQIVEAARKNSELELKMLREATFHVNGHLTANCPVLVRMALERMDGVKSVRASVDQARAWVDYTQGTSTAKMIALVKDRTGLAMDLVSDEP